MAAEEEWRWEDGTGGRRACQGGSRRRMRSKAHGQQWAGKIEEEELRMEDIRF